MPRISKEAYKKICVDVLKALNVPEEKGKIFAENLAAADMQGIYSHGLNHFSIYIGLIERGVINPKAEPSIVKETSSTALINGNMGLGQVVCKKAAELALKKAKETVVGSVGVFNCGHVGYIGHYTRMILEKGLIGIMYLNCDPSVAPYGGKDAILGTNPISFAIPAGEENPIIVDFATSAVAGGKVVDKIRKGEKIQIGWIIDKEGRDTTDPTDLFVKPFDMEKGYKLAGAQLPAAGHKGYGLALAVDVLAGALTGGRCNGEVSEGENFAFIQAINPGGFAPRDEFEKRVDKLIRKCISSTPRPGVEKVLIPGDLERKAEKEALELGIPIAQDIWDEVSRIGKKFGVNISEIVNVRRNRRNP